MPALTATAGTAVAAGGQGTALTGSLFGTPMITAAKVGTATSATIWTGKGLSLGLGIGLGAWGPILAVVAVGAAGYAFRYYQDNHADAEFLDAAIRNNEHV